MQALLQIIREYIIRKLAGQIDRSEIIAAATNQVVEDIVENGLTPEDEAIIDSTISS